MKRVRTKSSDIAGNMEPPKKSKETSKDKRSPSPQDKRTPSPRANGNLNGADHEAAKFNLKIISHGRVNGPIDDPDDGEEMLRFSVRDVANPPAKLRKNFTGLSPRLRKEIFSDKAARLKYDTIVSEMEKIMVAMEAAMKYDEEHQDEVDEPTATALIVSIQGEEGKHRGVSYAEELAQSTKRKDWAVTVQHRDLSASELTGGADIDDDEEPSSPTMTRPQEITKSKKKKDKHLKKARDRRLQVEVAGSGAEDGFM
ncbi:hypothetical protein LTR70_004735 [Exophiala xenobiotica]|uniref:RapZ C-terminal domain-containing protein n=1 Tax=Lithohypha guttulata TaxID=1690604 RepID=A0ABR0KC90_9EURO|nr:hypothetical protein LTR24_004351 [Lithohypha guttulata]KAK5319949.1 hypothetical protein LTR70_004735 [Exophiala xenobiotica]